MDRLLVLTRRMVALVFASMILLNTRAGQHSPEGSNGTSDSLRFTQWRIGGESVNSHFGYSLAGSGDLNGDGYSDLVVGAPLTGGGKVFVYFGSAVIDTVADITIRGLPGDRFGESIAVEDVNGDGYHDIVVGAPTNDTTGIHAGAAYVILGGRNMDNVADFLFTGNKPNGHFGNQVASLGDINGDGCGDFAVSDDVPFEGGPGTVHIYMGSAHMNNIPDLTFNRSAEKESFGISMASAGDVNGDGYGDFIIGAMRNDMAATNAGIAYLYFGGAKVDTIVDVTIPGPGDSLARFGQAVTGAGDINGDKYDDFIISAPGVSDASLRSGNAYVFFGSGNLDAVPDAVLEGSAGYTAFGYRLAPAADVNGDGKSDFLVSTPYGPGYNYQGQVSLFLGGSTPNGKATAVFSTDIVDAWLGVGIAGGGDFNGDGFSDFVSGTGVGSVIQWLSLRGSTRGRWQSQTPSTGNHLYCVSAVSERVAWCAGKSGTVLWTDDAGTTWHSPGTIPGNPTIYTISASDANTACAGAWTASTGVATLYKTSTTGISWEKKWEQTSGFINSIAMLNDRHGVLIGDPVNNVWTIHRTSDGGNTWTSIASPPVALPGEQAYGENSVCWVSSAIGYFATSLGRIFKTCNGGASWSYVNLPGLAPIKAIAVDKEGKGFAVGQSTIARTMNGWKTWTMGSFPAGTTYASAQISGKTLSLFAGSNFFTTRSMDTNWTVEESPAGTINHHVVRGAGENAYGWAVGNNGTVLHYEPTLVAVEHDPPTTSPDRFVLQQNYPNPFNPKTIISCQSPVAGNIRIAVHDVLGREMAVLIDAWKAPGKYQFTWDASPYASGIYFCRASVGQLTQTCKMMLIR